MNYRHGYHAGSFSDVFKHVLLLELIESLKQKDKPFCFIDTHAGRGLYDLTAEEAQKTAEADQGIKRLLNAPVPPCLQHYVDTVMACNQGVLRYYPGSPYLVKQCLREEDHMILTELHSDEYDILKALFHRDHQVGIHHLDAYLGLKAFLPPTPRRGLVLIDAAFEVKDEFDRIIAGLQQALRRWENGIYAVWYPIKDKAQVAQFLKALQALERPFLNVTLQPFADDYAFGLRANGMVIINPPWQLDEKLHVILPALWKVLSPSGQGAYSQSKYDLGQG